MTGQSEPTLLWHAYPLGLLGADQSGADRTCRHSLRELIEWLPYVASLGADAILLGPVFASLSHGYDTVSHRSIDDRLGDVRDLDALVAAASSYKIGVVLDGAFAYTSRAFWRLTDPADRETPWFVRDDDGELIPWRVDSLVTPDYESSGYQSYVVDTLTSWLDRGIAGWRLDSAWSIPASFWRRVLARVRETHPTAWFLGQVFDDDLPPVIDGTTMSSATEYAVMHGVREWFSGGDSSQLETMMRLHRRNSAVGSVDTTRRRSRSSPHTFLGNHDFARLADTIPAALLPAAYCVLLTLPGIPAIYYGDELAATSTWSQGGSDAALRPAMSPHDLHDLADGSRELLAAVRELGAFRHANTWLTSAVLDDITTHSGALTYVVTGDGGSVRVHVNRTPQTVQFPADEERPQLVLGTAIRQANGIDIPPHGWAIHRTPAR